MSTKSSSGPILVYLGANAQKALEQQLLALSPKIKFVESAVYPERQFSSETDARLGDAVIRFDADLRGEGGGIPFTPLASCNQIDIIDKVMDDKLLPLLWTRFGGQTRWRNLGEVKRYEVVYSLTKSAIDACRRHRPGAVVFSYEPHMLPMYVFKKVCEAMGIRTCTMAVSPFNWRVFLEQVNADEVSQSISRHEGRFHESVSRFIEEKTSDYSVAKPFYENRIHSKGWARSLLYKLKANGWKPHKLILGLMAASEYQRLATPRSGLKGMRYVCVFLQLQPEQTTLPDGGLFVHQLFAIQSLHAAASKLGLSLVIREHPATFEAAYNLTWRPRDFYRTVQNIGPRIFFDEVGADPYLLIKNAVAVSAITGTVLLESLLQGRPVIAFGKHPLRGYVATSFVDHFTDEQDLSAKLAAALALPAAAIVADAQRYLHRIYAHTYGPVEYVGNAGMTLALLRQSRYVALQQILESLTRAEAPASRLAVS